VGVCLQVGRTEGAGADLIDPAIGSVRMMADLLVLESSKLVVDLSSISDCNSQTSACLPRF
jgi:hypothetical protein